MYQLDYYIFIHINPSDIIKKKIIEAALSEESDLLFNLAANLTVLLLQVSASKVLQETCNYIRSLHTEVDDLSERLSQFLATIDADAAEAAIIRSLIM